MTARTLLKALVAAKPGRRKAARTFILQNSDGRAVARVAFEEYDRTGKEAFLLHGLSLLEDFGQPAWPALHEIARLGRSECELFLGAIVRCPGVPSAERVSALRMLAQNPSASVRSGLLEHLGKLPDKERRPVLELLSKDEDPDIRAEVVDRFSPSG